MKTRHSLDQWVCHKKKKKNYTKNNKRKTKRINIKAV